MQLSFFQSKRPGWEMTEQERTLGKLWLPILFTTLRSHKPKGIG